VGLDAAHESFHGEQETAHAAFHEQLETQHGADDAAAAEHTAFHASTGIPE
jgi:hypothetical protein